MSNWSKSLIRFFESSSHWEKEHTRWSILLHVLISLTSTPKKEEKKKSNKEEDLKSLLKLQEELQENLKLSDLLQFSKSKFKIVKMHDTTHHIFTIMLFEDPQSYSTEVGELLNKILIKEVYSRGNHHESFDFVGFFQFFQSHFPSFESDTHSDIQKRRRTYLCRISQEFEKRSTRTMENVWISWLVDVHDCISIFFP